jgi:hypothetical protein
MDLQRLQSLVHRLDVGWHVRSELGMKAEPIGFVVELTASHGHPHHRPVLGCPECQPVVEALTEIAHAIVPRDEPDVRCDIHVDTGRHEFEGAKPVMTATITILHLGDVTAPQDQSERQALEEIVSALRRIGAASRAS